MPSTAFYLHRQQFEAGSLFPYFANFRHWVTHAAHPRLVSFRPMISWEHFHKKNLEQQIPVKKLFVVIWSWGTFVNHCITSHQWGSSKHSSKLALQEDQSKRTLNGLFFWVSIMKCLWTEKKFIDFERIKKCTLDLIRLQALHSFLKSLFMDVKFDSCQLRHR